MVNASKLDVNHMTDAPLDAKAGNAQEAGIKSVPSDPSPEQIIEKLCEALECARSHVEDAAMPGKPGWVRADSDLRWIDTALDAARRWR